MTGFTDKLDWYLSHQVLPESHITVFKCDEKANKGSKRFTNVQEWLQEVTGHHRSEGHMSPAVQEVTGGQEPQMFYICAYCYLN